MRLIDLHPHFCPIANGLFEVTFDCPVCGVPYRVRVLARLNGPPGPDGSGIWEWTADPFSNIPPRPINWDSVSIGPSIHNFNHGNKKSCSAHISVSKGEVTYVS